MRFGPGNRLCYVWRGDVLIILNGGDKDSQARDIAKTKRMAKELDDGTESSPYDSADLIETEEDILMYLEIAMEGNDPARIARALGTVARSKGMTEIAKKTGLGRQALYTALSENGNPTLETLMAVLNALGLELTVRKKAA